VLSAFHSCLCPYLAYRLEPLFHEHYQHICPVKVYNYEMGRKPYEGVGYKYIMRKEPYARMKKEKRKSNSRTTVPPEVCGLARSDSGSSGGECRLLIRSGESFGISVYFRC
jgi:hypothetical protein